MAEWKFNNGWRLQWNRCTVGWSTDYFREQTAEEAALHAAGDVMFKAGDSIVCTDHEREVAAMFNGRSPEERVRTLFLAGRIKFDAGGYVLAQMEAAIADRIERLRDELHAANDRPGGEE